VAEPVERQVLRRMTPSDDEIVINFGPQHPSTHGVIDFVTQTNGEIIRRSIPDIGYLHRGWRRLARRSATRASCHLPTASTTWRPCCQ